MLLLRAGINVLICCQWMTFMGLGSLEGRASWLQGTCEKQPRLHGNAAISTLAADAMDTQILLSIASTQRAR